MQSYGKDPDAPVLFTDSAFAYQWFKNGIPIEEAITDTLYVSEPGTYTVVIYSEEGCANESEAMIVGPTGMEINQNAISLRFYPNPVTDSFTVSFTDIPGKKTIVIFQSNGNQIDRREVYGNQARFESAEYPAGVYFAKVEIGGKVKTINFIKN